MTEYSDIVKPASRAISSDITNVDTLADIPAGSVGEFHLSTGKLVSGDGNGIGTELVIKKLLNRLSNNTYLELPVNPEAPTLTLSADAATTTISGAVTTINMDNALVYCPGKMTFVASAAGNGGPTQNYYGDLADSYSPYTIVTNALEVELSVMVPAPTVPALVQLIIDGQLAQKTAYVGSIAASSNIWKKMKFVFPTAKTRRITFLIARVLVSSFAISSKYKFFPVSEPALRMYAITDSYGGGGYWGHFSKSIDQDLAAAIGVEGTTLNYVGSTGYKAAPSGKSFISRFEAYVTARGAPDIVMVSGGINDTTAYTQAESYAAILDFYTRAKAVAPNALYIVVGNMVPQQAQYSSQPSNGWVRASIESVIQSIGVHYIYLSTLNNTILSSWGTVYDDSASNGGVILNNPNALFTGNSTVATAATDTSSYLYVDSDTVHPTTGITPSTGAESAYSDQCGRAYISRFVLNGVRQAINNW